MSLNKLKSSKDVARAAISMSMTSSRQDELNLKNELKNDNVLALAFDYGGEFFQSITKIVDRAVVAAKREELINESHVEHGALAGATREALAQLSTKAMGLNVGGKIAIARSSHHLAVSIFFEIGLGQLNEVCLGIGHRAL